MQLMSNTSNVKHSEKGIWTGRSVKCLETAKLDRVTSSAVTRFALVPIEASCMERMTKFTAL